MSTITTYSYEGTPIAFERGAGVMINATQMAKRFGESKAPKFWLSNQSTKEFLTTLSYGTSRVCTTTKVTPKGQQYFIKIKRYLRYDNKTDC